MKIELYDIVHKPYRIPDDKLYVPIQTGCAMSGTKYLGNGILRDDVGDHISDRNSAYNLLCPLYWVWKNSTAEYVGIVHYRRLICGKKKLRYTWDDVLTYEQAEGLCKEHDIILCKPRRYLFFTLRLHYIKSFKGLEKVHENDLNTLREVIKERNPEYLEAHDKVMNRSWGHLLNIYLMKKEYFNEHCDFMFPILEECERRLQGKRHDYNRYIAALAEFLPDIWIEKNGYNYIELPLFMAEEPSFIKKLVLQIGKTLIGKKNPYNYDPGQ